jgi:3'-phosphoadenosine 5'-phosphosulfate sulfotransferase (PAPS reductase)/FAD synthetase
MTDRKKTLTVISLGAGVQSSTMALMAAKGELPKPDCAIFADTGYEPKKIYEYLEWIKTTITIIQFILYQKETLKMICYYLKIQLIL